MPQYTNPQLPEEVNNSDARPLRSFVAMAAALLALGAGAAEIFAYGTAVLLE